jgi:hypothetical protein
MNPGKKLRGFRWFGGFLLAPAVVPLILYVALRLAVVGLSPEVSDARESIVRLYVLVFGVGLVYLGVLCLGIPYVLLLRRLGPPRLRTIMVPTSIMSWIYAVTVYTSLQQDYPHAGTVAALCVPAVLLAGVLFHLIALWRAPDHEEISLLLDAYPHGPKSTFPVR